MRSLAILLLAVLSTAFVAAPARAGETVRVLVTEVPDGSTLIVDRPVDGTRDVRLLGIEAPRLALGRPGMPTWPLAHAAREILQALALGRTVRLLRGERTLDRYGRVHAHVHRDDGAWLQEEMLRRGFARVHGDPNNRLHLDAMLAVEATAREAAVGIWSHPFYAVRTPETVKRDIDTFQIVEGRVVEARRVKRHVYLNFGADWRTDFTVSIAVSGLRRFEADGLVPLSLAGRVIRVRGWITSFNGPLIEATHPEQIEVVDEAAGDDPASHSPCCRNRPRTRAAWNMAR